MDSRSECNRWGHSVVFYHDTVFTFGGFGREPLEQNTSSMVGVKADARLCSVSSLVLDATNVPYVEENQKNQKNLTNLENQQKNLENQKNQQQHMIQPNFVSSSAQMIQNAREKLVHTTGELPSARMRHSAVLFENKMIVFGGRSNPSQPMEDVYVLDLDCLVWKKVESKGPCGRFRHAATLCPLGMFVFGGKTDGESLNDSWILSCIFSCGLCLEYKGYRRVTFYRLICKKIDVYNCSVCLNEDEK